MAEKGKKLYEQKLEEIKEHIDNELKTGKQITDAKIHSVKQKVTEMFLLIANLEGRNEQLERDLKEEREKSKGYMLNMPTTSYATITRKGATVKNINPNVTKPEGTIILITPKEGEDTRRTEGKIRQILNPKEDKINIKSIKTTKKTVIIETEKKVDADKILCNEKLKEIVKMEKPKKKLPKIILYDIPITLENKDIKESLYRQNFEGELKEEDFHAEFNLIFKTGPREKEVVNHVAEVSPKMRNLLINKGKLYLPFLAISVKDFLVVPRCLKCQDYGHIAKFCKEENRVCAHCGLENHERKDCPNKEKAQTCIPCSRRHKKCNKTNKEWKECDTYKMLRQREIDRTEYGK